MRQFLCLVMGVYGGCFALTAHACRLNIAYSDQASPPYYLGEGQVIPANPGIAVDLVNLAAVKLGCKIAWKRLPNRRAQRALEQGHVDAMLLLSYNPQRAAYAAYPMAGDAPDPALRLARLRYSVFVKKGDTLQWQNQQFSPRPALVGANAGFSVVQDLRAMGLTVDEAPSTSNNVQKLLLGRISAFVGQDLQTDLVLEERGITSVHKLPEPFSSKDYYLPFSQHYFAQFPANATRLWTQIAEVRKAYGKELARKYVALN